MRGGGRLYADGGGVAHNLGNGASGGVFYLLTLIGQQAARDLHAHLGHVRSVAALKLGYDCAHGILVAHVAHVYAAQRVLSPIASGLGGHGGAKGVHAGRDRRGVC